MKRILSACFLCISFSLSAQVNFISTEACYGTQNVLVGSSDSADAVISSWNWDMDNDGQYDDATGKMTNYFFPQEDTFNVGLKIVFTNGDSATVSKNVVVNPLPQVNFSVDNLCEGKAAIYINQSAILWGMVDETKTKWDFNNDGTFDDVGNDTTTYTCGPASTYITKLECVSDKGCSAFSTKTTQVFHQPNADFTVQGACVGGNTQFINSSTIQNENMSFYLWNFGDGAQATSNGNTTHSFSNQQTYNIELVAVSENFCKDTFTMPVTISQLVNPGFSVQNECLGGTTNFINSTTIDSTEIISNYQWTFGDATSETNSGNAAHGYAAIGTYAVTLTATTQNNCVNTSTDTINIAQLISAAFSAANACFGEATAFTDNSTTQQGEVISILQWNYGDGTSGTANSHEYAATGNYNVTLIAISQNSCKDTVSGSITVNPLPVVSLAISGDTINDSTFYKGDNITLAVNGNAGSYSWSNNAITSSISVSDSGTYMVTATDANGCSQVLSKKIIVKEVPDTAEAGNDIITPNADGFNDVFMVKDVSAYKQCSLNIYNIWNEEVFSVSEYKNDWDGNEKSGKALDAGAYYYILKCDDKPQTIGTVNILR